MKGDAVMPRKTYRPEEIIAKLCHAEVLLDGEQQPKWPATLAAHRRAGAGRESTLGEAGATGILWLRAWSLRGFLGCRVASGHHAPWAAVAPVGGAPPDPRRRGHRSSRWIRGDGGQLTCTESATGVTHPF